MRVVGEILNCVYGLVTGVCAKITVGFPVYCGIEGSDLVFRLSFHDKIDVEFLVDNRAEVSRLKVTG